MAKRKNKTKSKGGGFSLFVYLIIVILLLGVVGAVALNLYNDYTASTGIYIEYNDEKYTADDDNNGIVLEYDSTITFSIDSTDWGIYSVTDCEARIVSNVSDNKIFEFHIGDNNYRFTSGIDLTSAFTDNYKGTSLTINDDGSFSFSLYVSVPSGSSYMAEVLKVVYGADIVTIDSDIDVSTYPYFAVQITSPDGSQTVTIPFVINNIGVGASGIEIDTTHIYF